MAKMSQPREETAERRPDAEGGDEAQATRRLPTWQKALLATSALTRLSGCYGKELDSIDPAALADLEAYRWPGNVRELLHVMERAVIVNSGTHLQAHMLPSLGVRVHEEPPPQRAGAASPPQPKSEGHRFGDEVIPLVELERLAILHALKQSGGNRNNAAMRLGVSPATIYRKLKSYGLTGVRKLSGRVSEVTVVS